MPFEFSIILVLIFLSSRQEVEKALGEMLGVPVKLIQPGSRAAPGGDPMTISLPLIGITELGSLSACVIAYLFPLILLRMVLCWVAI